MFFPNHKGLFANLLLSNKTLAGNTALQLNLVAGIPYDCSRHHSARYPKRILDPCSSSCMMLIAISLASSRQHTYAYSEYDNPVLLQSPIFHRIRFNAVEKVDNHEYG